MSRPTPFACGGVPRAFFFAALWMAAFMVGPSPASAPAGEGSHPLLGRIYAPGARRFLAEPDLLERMRRADAVYLGEKHDNPAHHRLQARLLRSLLRRGRRPAVAFEMFPRDVGSALSAHLADPHADLSKVPDIVGWKRRGWPDWAMYAPLVAIAHRAGLPLVAADLSASLSRRIARRGLGALPPALARELALGPPEEEHRARVLEELYESHCRVIPKDALGGLYDAWRARNRAMALSLRRAIREGAGGAVLITGAGHADRELGVPRDLAALEGGLRQFSLSFAEVRPQEKGPDAYLDRPGAYDALWFTARHERDDPCVKYRRQLEGLRK